MIRTDGRPTIAHYGVGGMSDEEADRLNGFTPDQTTTPDSCEVLTAPGTVKEIRLRPGELRTPDDYTILDALREKHPHAAIVIPPEEEAA